MVKAAFFDRRPHEMSLKSRSVSVSPRLFAMDAIDLSTLCNRAQADGKSAPTLFLSEQMTSVTTQSLTPYGTHFFRQSQAGKIEFEYKGKTYTLRSEPDFKRISHCLHHAQNGSLASIMGDSDAEEFDKAFAAWAIPSDNDKDTTVRLVKPPPAMPCDLGIADAAPIFATAFTFKNLEEMNEALDALGKNMPPPKRARVVLAGFALLSEEDKKRMLGLRGALLFAEAFAILEPEQMGQALNTLREHIEVPGDCARAMLAGLDLIPKADRIRVLGTLGEAILASLFVLADPEDLNRVLDVPVKEMVPARRAQLIIGGFNLLSKGETAAAGQRRALDRLSAQLFAAAFAFDKPEDIETALDMLGKHLRPADWVRATLAAFALLPPESRIRVRDMHGGPLMAKMLAHADPKDMHSVLDVLGMDMDPLKLTNLISAAAYTLDNPELMEKALVVLEMRLLLKRDGGRAALADWVRATLAGFALLSRESRNRVQAMRGGKLMAKMLRYADPQDMSSVLNVLGMDLDPVNHAYLLVNGFICLSNNKTFAPPPVLHKLSTELFAAALTLRKPEDIDAALDALKKHLAPAEWVRATLDAFALLPKESRNRVRDMHGGSLMAKMLGHADPEDMSSVLDVLGMDLDPVTRAYLILGGFMRLSKNETSRADQRRVLEKLAVQLFAAAFTLRVPDHTDRALDAVAEQLSPAGWVRPALAGFALLPKENKIHVLKKMGKSLMTAMLGCADPDDMSSVLDVLGKDLNHPVNRARLISSAFRAFAKVSHSEAQMRLVLDKLSAQLFAAARDLDNDRDRNETRDALGRHMSPAEFAQAMLAEPAPS
ncbi:hypothetical protein [Paraburkholderia sediminicola]|uniref:hypothetical protein n=1 Tax=Paraburkholderia sediminicola TaxID=458836 RepID=UPI0038B8BE5D